MQSSMPSFTRQQADDNTDTLGHCPYLGSKTDPAVPSEFPSEDNRCLSTRLAVPISTLHQENYCFSSQYEACPVYRERAKRVNGANLVPVAAIHAAGPAEPALSWADEPDLFALAGPGAAAAAAVAPPAAQPPLGRVHWEDNTHPDFRADMAAASTRRRPPVDRRPWLLGLLLLALLPLVWWLFNNLRPDTREAAGTVEGVIVTLPTLLATGEAETPPGGDSGNDGALPLPPVPTGVNEGASAPTPEPTAEATTSDLENIAATATALFADATAVAGCVAPSWWTGYVVEEGDTIEALALARGILPEELIAVNCLTGPDLEAGAQLLLPPVGVIAILPSATATPTATATATRPRGLPTRAPILFPTPTFPLVIILTPLAPTQEPTDVPATRPPAQPTRVPTLAVPATATVPNPGLTATPPSFFQTATPPSAVGTPTPTTTVQPTQTFPPPTP
ncbi:MAG: LysM peptidoglycan-binding domain-containing protein [Candidatus Promineofilum sp.]|nr:LysM peptidoglycan-binding domain-containing protein [Promineifilum sp.]